MSSTIYGTPYDDYLTGDADDNWFMGSRGNDTLDGGDGNDTIDFTNIPGSYLGGYDSMWPSYIHVNLNTGRLEALFTFANGVLSSPCITELRSIENVVGTLFDDVFTGNVQANRLYGGSGDDSFYGSGGSDLLDGGSGMDTADYSTLGAGFSIVAYLQYGSINKSYFLSQSVDTVVNIENVVGTCRTPSSMPPRHMPAWRLIRAWRALTWRGCRPVPRRPAPTRWSASRT